MTLSLFDSNRMRVRRRRFVLQIPYQRVYLLHLIQEIQPRVLIFSSLLKVEPILMALRRWYQLYRNHYSRLLLKVASLCVVNKNCTIYVSRERWIETPIKRREKTIHKTLTRKLIRAAMFRVVSLVLTRKSKRPILGTTPIQLLHFQESTSQAPFWIQHQKTPRYNRHHFNCAGVNIIKKSK